MTRKLAFQLTCLIYSRIKTISRVSITNSKRKLGKNIELVNRRLWNVKLFRISEHKPYISPKEWQVSSHIKEIFLKICRIDENEELMSHAKCHMQIENE